jgi:hypothetical protein
VTSQAVTASAEGVGSALSADYKAFAKYRQHSQACAECQRRLHNCPAGAALWEDYRDARGPILDPIPGRRP